MQFNSDHSYLDYDRRRKARERNAKKWLEIREKAVHFVLMSLLVGACIYLFYYPHIRDVFASGEENVSVSEEEPALPEPVETPAKEVQIKVEVNWTQERIVEEIHNVFPDAPIMVEVAKCEGVRHGKLDPTAYNPTNGSGDTGIFQISEYWNGDWYRSLGFTDMEDIKQNLAFARVMYDTYGLQPWEASRHCWSK